MRALCLLTVCLALPARGQDVASLQQGVRIRVHPVTGDSRTGTYLGLTGDSLRFLGEKSTSIAAAIPMEQVKAVQVSGGRSRSRGLVKGALMGSAIGVVAGAILGAATYDDVQETWCIIACSRAGNAAFTGVVLGTAGLAIGSVYGAMEGSELWKTVPLNRLAQPGG